MDVKKYKTYVKEAKRSVKNFYKGIDDLIVNDSDSEPDDNKPVIFENPNNDLQFYLDNEKNEKMKIFYQ